ncbi:MAG: hypothetical protein WA003_15545, partial [Desulfuromonadaceae bacterium]
MADIFDQVAGGDIFDQVSPGISVGPAPAQFPGTGNALVLPAASSRPGRSTVALSDQSNQVGRAPSADIRDTAKSMVDDVVGTGGESWAGIAGKSAARGFFVVPQVISEGGNLIRKSLDMPESGFRKGLKQIDELITPDVGESPLKNYASQAARTISEMAGSGLSLPLMAVYSGSTKSGEILDAGKSVQKALAGAAVQTALEYWTEKLPFEILQKPGLKFFERLGQGLVADVPGELIATAGEMSLIDTPILGKKYTSDDYAKALLDTAIVSGLVTGGATVGSQAINALAKKPQDSPQGEPSLYGTDPNNLGDIFDQVSLPPGSGPAPALPAVPARPLLTSDRTAGEGFTMAPSPGIAPNVAKNAEIDQLVSEYQPEAPTAPGPTAPRFFAPKIEPRVEGGAAPTISTETALDVLDARGLPVNQAPGETIRRPVNRQIGPIGQVILKKVHKTEAGATKALNNRIEKGRLAADEYGVFPVEGGFQIQTVPVEQRAAMAQAKAEAASQKQAGIAATEVAKSDPIYSIIQEAKRNPINLEALERDYPDLSKEITKKFPGIFKRGGKVFADDFAESEEFGYETLDDFVEALKATQPMSQAAPVKLEQDNAHFEELRQAGFVPVGDKLTAGNLRKGDQVIGRIQGGMEDEFTVLGQDSQGRVVLQGKGKEKIDLLDEVQVEFIKQGEPQENQDYVPAPIDFAHLKESLGSESRLVREHLDGLEEAQGEGEGTLDEEEAHGVLSELIEDRKKFVFGDRARFREDVERFIGNSPAGQQFDFRYDFALMNGYHLTAYKSGGVYQEGHAGEETPTKSFIAMSLTIGKLSEESLIAAIDTKLADGDFVTVDNAPVKAHNEIKEASNGRNQGTVEGKNDDAGSEQRRPGYSEDGVQGVPAAEEGSPEAQEVTPESFVASLPVKQQLALQKDISSILDSAYSPAQKLKSLQILVKKADVPSAQTVTGAVSQEAAPAAASETRLAKDLTPADHLRAAADKLEAAENLPAVQNAYDRAHAELDKVAPTIKTGSDVVPAPHHVYMNARDMADESKAVKLSAPYKEFDQADAMRVADALKLYASEELNASMRQSEVFATNLDGKPLYVFIQGEGKTQVKYLLSDGKIGPDAPALQRKTKPAKPTTPLTPLPE